MNATTESITAATVNAWIEQYLVAWHSNEPSDIAELFTPDAEYHESPYSTHWIGRDEIIAGWRGRWDWQQGGWTFEHTTQSIEGDTAVVKGVGHYAELGDFGNHWTLTFDISGRCVRFSMINSEQE